MYLLTIHLDSPGQSLRLLLWIILPIGILYLLVSTWLQLRRNENTAGGLRLAVEGFGGHPDSENSYVPGSGNGRIAGGDNGYAGRKETVSAVGTADEVTEEAAGQETIYRGILWMKEKYEQYREQADKRYEMLREELSRSEQRYQDLLLSMEQNKATASGIAAGEAWVGRLDGELTVVRGELGAKQVIIEELEEQLRIERLKVEEMVVKLQTNSQLLLNIYKELDKSVEILEE